MVCGGVGFPETLVSTKGDGDESSESILLQRLAVRSHCAECLSSNDDMPQPNASQGNATQGNTTDQDQIDNGTPQDAQENSSHSVAPQPNASQGNASEQDQMEDGTPQPGDTHDNNSDSVTLQPDDGQGNNSFEVGTPPVEGCSTAVVGEECHLAVVEAQHALILQHPEWYPGLSHHSTFEEFQNFLWIQGMGNCSKPCNLCHTALQGDGCWEKVQWAMSHGIREHPEWYPGLVSGSSFEEFQSLLHRTAEEQGGCPTEPCNLCRVVTEPGELCYQEVDWAMTHGIHSHPEWYPGLSPNASRLEFQNFLSQKYSCPPACGLCHTAVAGEDCYIGVMWAKRHGIMLFPDWYPGLTEDSSLHEFQAHLHRERHHNCPMPCSADS